MKRTKVSGVVTALLAGLIVAASVSPAAADFTPQVKDIVGTGSDTSQFAMNTLADGVRSGGSFTPGYNIGASARMVSFDAITLAGVTNDPIVLKVGTPSILRPNGSTAGKALLFGATNNVNANFARSSSSLSATEAAAGLQLYPFATDGLKLAVKATGSNAPAAITPAQMVQIYNGTVSNWSQIGGTDGVIKPLIPQPGSGSRAFFVAQLKAANGGTDVVLAPTVTNTQENEDVDIANNPNAVAPFSTGRALINPTIRLTGGFSATRALYNVVRNADVNKPFVAALFGPSGFVCSPGATPIIAAAGFSQLASSLDGGVCGEKTQAATTNFTVN